MGETWTRENLGHGFKSRLCNLLAVGLGPVPYPTCPASVCRTVVPDTGRTRTSCAVFGTSDGTWYWLWSLNPVCILIHSIDHPHLFFFSTGKQTQGIIQARPELCTELHAISRPLHRCSPQQLYQTLLAPREHGSPAACPLVLFSVPPPKIVAQEFPVALAFHKTGTSMGRVRLGDRGSLSQGELVVCRSGKGRPRSGWRWGQYSPQRGGGSTCV